MESRKYKSVWDAIEDTPDDAERMRRSSTIMRALQNHINARVWTESEAAEALHVTKLQISELLRGKISSFSLGALLAMVAAAGL